MFYAAIHGKTFFDQSNTQNQEMIKIPENVLLLIPAAPFSLTTKPIMDYKEFTSDTILGWDIFQIVKPG